MSLPIPLHSLLGRPGAPWPGVPLLDLPNPPEPIPLPGDLRVAHMVGPDVGPHLAGRWQIQVYDASTGRWRALIGRDGRRPAYWRAEPTFASEAAALQYLLTFVRRRARKP